MDRGNLYRYVDVQCCDRRAPHIVLSFWDPETIVTDNGTCFVSAELEAFLNHNGIKHVTSGPYHPSSNGLAERAVQVVKKGLKKVTKGTMRSRLVKKHYLLTD